MDETTLLLLSFAIILGASVVQGATAFGFALVAVPLLLLFLPATETIAISLTVGSVLNLMLIRIDRSSVDWREVLSFLPAIGAGAVAGMLLLKSLNSPRFSAVVGITILVMAIIMLAHRSWKAGPGQPLRQTVGIIAGLLFGATSMGGPPLVLYLTGRGLTKEGLRATLAVTFLMGNLLALAAFTAGGLFGTSLALRSLLLAVAVIPGGLAGRALTSSLNPLAFRTLVLVCMATLASIETLLNLTSL